MPSWPEASDFVRAIAELFKALQWPFVALVIALFFRPDISKLLHRMKKGKLLGAEAEFENTLDELEKGTSEGVIGTATEIPAPTSDGGSTPIESTPTEKTQSPRPDASLAKEVAELAGSSPISALMLLGTEIDTTVRALVYHFRAALHPMSDARFKYQFRSMEVTANALRSINVIDLRLFENLMNFQRIRSLVIHEGLGDDLEILRALDSGLKMYAELQTRFLAPP